MRSGRGAPDCEFALWGTTENTAHEYWAGSNGHLLLVEERDDDFRNGVIIYHRRDGVVLDPPEVEEY